MAPWLDQVKKCKAKVTKKISHNYKFERSLRKAEDVWVI